MNLFKTFKKLHFHKWKYTAPIYRTSFEEDLGMATVPGTRTCKVCGKAQQQETMCLGLNPPRYTHHWRNL